mmetsp:Transcript_3297/g.6494  ORF Transcript_3297/g.6494 Transcript_3297/m.6494 type:complete len:185 (-) Transcript_3297:59-613(-)
MSDAAHLGAMDGAPAGYAYSVTEPMMPGRGRGRGRGRGYIVSDPPLADPGGSTGSTSAAVAAAGVDVSVTDEEMLSLVERLTDEGFLSFVDEFVEENAHYFVEGEEHRHYYNEIHQKYQRFFEARVEAWLRERGQSPEAFAWAVLQGGIASDVAEELLAVSNYEAFVVMMRSRRDLLLAEAAGD